MPTLRMSRPLSVRRLAPRSVLHCSTCAGLAHWITGPYQQSVHLLTFKQHAPHPFSAQSQATSCAVTTWRSDAFPSSWFPSPPPAPVAPYVTPAAAPSGISNWLLILIILLAILIPLLCCLGLYCLWRRKVGGRWWATECLNAIFVCFPYFKLHKPSRILLHANHVSCNSI